MNIVTQINVMFLTLEGDASFQVWFKQSANQKLLTELAQVVAEDQKAGRLDRALVHCWQAMNANTNNECQQHLLHALHHNSYLEPQSQEWQFVFDLYYMGKTTISEGCPKYTPWLVAVWEAIRQGWFVAPDWTGIACGRLLDSGQVVRAYLLLQALEKRAQTANNFSQVGLEQLRNTYGAKPT